MRFLATGVREVVTVPTAIITSAIGQIEFSDAPAARAAIHHQRANEPPPQFSPRRFRGRQADRVIERDFLVLPSNGVIQANRAESCVAIDLVSDAGALLFRVGIGPNPAPAV